MEVEGEAPGRRRRKGSRTVLGGDRLGERKSPSASLLLEASCSTGGLHGSVLRRLFRLFFSFQHLDFWYIFVPRGMDPESMTFSVDIVDRVLLFCLILN